MEPPEEKREKPAGSSPVIRHLRMGATEPERARHAGPLCESAGTWQPPDAGSLKTEGSHDIPEAINQDRPFGFLKLGRPLHEGTETVDPAARIIDLPDGAS